MGPKPPTLLSLSPLWTRSRRSRVTVAHAKHLPCPRFCSEGRAGRHLAVVLLLVLPGRSRRRRSRRGGGGRTASTLPHACVAGGPHGGRDLLVASSLTHPARPDRLHALPPESPEHCLHDAQLTLSQLQAGQACTLQSMAVCFATLSAIAAGFGTPMCLVTLLLALLQGGQVVAGCRPSLFRSFALSRLARLLCMQLVAAGAKSSRLYTRRLCLPPPLPALSAGEARVHHACSSGVT